MYLTNGSIHEIWGAGGNDADDYDVAMSESGNSGHYTAQFDAAGNITDEGTYRIGIYEQGGGNPADVDIPAIGEGEINWDGEQEVSLLGISDAASSPVVEEDDSNPITVDPGTGDALPGGGAGSGPGGGAEGGGGSVVSGGSSGC